MPFSPGTEHEEAAGQNSPGHAQGDKRLPFQVRDRWQQPADRDRYSYRSKRGPPPGQESAFRSQVGTPGRVPERGDFSRIRRVGHGAILLSAVVLNEEVARACGAATGREDTAIGREDAEIGSDGLSRGGPPH
jgi:hypothetical protein